jgi:hypothetical protein
MLRRKRVLVYAVADDKELIMVGSTGTVQNDGLKNKEWWFKRKDC